MTRSVLVRLLQGWIVTKRLQRRVRTEYNQ
jgi:hypothetical protein